MIAVTDILVRFGQSILFAITARAAADSIAFVSDRSIPVVILVLTL